MICTNIEQSKHLLELGLDPESADMTYLLFSDGKYSIKVEIGERQKGESFLPAWSLSALLEVMPKEKVIGFYFITTLKEWCFTIKHNETKRHFTNEDKLTAAYEMVCWLLRNNLITNN